MMRKAIAFLLLLVLAVGLFAPALADYPKVSFTKQAKNQWVEYGSKISWRLKFNVGSYRKIKIKQNEYFYRAGFTMRIIRGKRNEKIMDYNYSFNGHQQFSIDVRKSKCRVFRKPVGYDTYDVLLTTYYRPAVGSGWTKIKSYHTNMYVY